MNLDDILKGLKRNTLDRTTIDERIGQAFNNVKTRASQINTRPQKPYASPLPQPRQIKADQPQGNLIQKYFDPSNAGQSNFNFWNTNVARGLGTIQQIQQNPPKINLTQYANNVQNPIGQTAANIGLGVAENFINIPQRIALAGNKLGTNIRTGQITNPRVAVNTAASVASPLLDIATMGGGTIAKNIGTQALKQSGKMALKQTIKKGIAEGAGYGALFGGLQGLSEGDKADFLEGFKGMVAGGTIGALLGGGVSGASGAIGKVFSSYKNLGFNDDIAKKETIEFFKRGGQVRDSRGRFSVKTQSKPNAAQKESWAKVNQVLGRPLDTPVYPSDLDTALTKQLGISDDFSIPQMGLSIKEVDSNKLLNGQALSSTAIKTKSGKVKLDNLPTQVEIKNRAEINAGNPDLYDQRKVKLGKAFGNPEPLPWESNTPIVRDKKKAEMTLSDATSSKLNKEWGNLQKKNPDVNLASSSLESVVERSGFDVRKKVNFIDMFRTPDRVLKKMGLGKEADELRVNYDKYLSELPKEIDKITAWSQRVPKESNERIFQYLDGQGTQLTGEELKVAKEIRQYLKGWADRLGLPEDNRVSHYITHIFDRELKSQEIDPDLAKIIRERVAGSVYDPFLEKRLGAKGYIQDTWQALDAYVKRATRKANLDPTLKKISDKAENFEESQFDYIKGYIARVNMQPTKLDNLIDNTLKQTPLGYKLGARPITVITKKMRQLGYRGTLGLNVGSALRNLTQFSNTYAKLGEKYTALGYMKLVKSLADGNDELSRVGVLRNEFIQDRNINATRKFAEKTDNVLFTFFELAERINRGSAYFGAKAKGLSKGMSENEAIEYAKKIVRDTQFSFGSIDNPKVLSSDLSKTLLQFQSYNLKQAEFLGEMVSNKEYIGVGRYAISSAVMMYTLGQLIGIKPEQLVPFLSEFTDESRIGKTPAINAITEVGGALLGKKDKYGNELDLGDRIAKGSSALIPLIPAGVQIKKTYQGIEAGMKGYSESKSGRIQYPVPQDPVSRVRAAVFGKSQLPQAREYFDKKRSPLGESQSEVFKNLPQDQRQNLYRDTMTSREQKKSDKEITSNLKSGKQIPLEENKIRWLDDQGEIQTVDLSEKALKVKSGIDAYDKDSSNTPIAKARKIYTAPDSEISRQQKQDIYKKLGFTEEDVRYDYMSGSKFSNDERVQYVIGQNLTKEQLYERLITGRRESVSGNMFIRDGVLDDLAEQGIISKDEAKYIKKLKYDKNGKPKIKLSGRGKGAKLKSVKFVPLKLTDNKKSILDENIGDLASLSTQQIQTPKVNFSVPNLGMSSGGGIPQVPKFKIKFNL